jgi:uncharacterized protein (TIGR02996 family)
VASDQAFLDAILEAPADPAPMLVYADFLAERGRSGDEDLAYAFRWMAARGRRPGDRQRPRVRLPWAWWPEATGPDVLDDFADRRRCPHAWLPRLLYLALPWGDYAGHLYYRDYLTAVRALAEGLARLRGLVSLDRDLPLT